jgi:hypothetical protein
MNIKANAICKIANKAFGKVVLEAKLASTSPDLFSNVVLESKLASTSPDLLGNVVLEAKLASTAPDLFSLTELKLQHFLCLILLN